MPHVSVLMPVYNGETYLNQAIDSVLAQTFSDFELIIINDGSTDGTEAIIDSYSDARIKAHFQVNQGVARSLNYGLTQVTGNYVWRHDADDISLPQQLQTQLDFMKAYPHVALVSTQIAFMTDNGKIAYDMKQPKDAYFQGKPHMKVERSQFNPYSPITHATVLIRTEVFNEVGVYRTEFKTSEDTDLWLRIIEKFEAVVLHYCPYFVRLNATSATQVYKSTNNFYRDLAFAFADERKHVGTDVLQRGETMPKPKQEQFVPTAFEKNGRNFRADLLNFQYKVALNAKDYKNILLIAKHAIRSGWKLSNTWKALLFPILGETVLKRGVKIKRKFR